MRVRGVLRVMFVLGVGVAVIGAVSGAERSGHARAPVAETVWDFSTELSAEQLAVNARIHARLPPDTCDAEGAFDHYAHELATQGTPEARVALQRLEHAGGRWRQVAAGRAFLYLSQSALAAGDSTGAADDATHVYLSGVPHRIRLEALRVYGACGDPGVLARWVELIEAGAQDSAFAPLLGELKARIGP